MTNFTTRRAFLAVALLTGCHTYAYYEPALPPPPPPTPPPGAPWTPPIEDSSSSSVPPASPPSREEEGAQRSANSETQGQPDGGPLPALPSQAPRYAPATPSAPPSASEWVR